MDDKAGIPKVLPHGCLSAYQDLQYGKGMRLCNSKYTKGKITGYRCTVCGKEV